jgi:hypothetical protein
MTARQDRVATEKKKKEDNIAKEKLEKHQTETKDQIIKDVATWAKGKTIHVMLNEVNKYKSPSKKLKRNHSFTPVNKAYRKALLKIHPDKHMASGDFAAHTRATEMFKIINTTFTDFKEAQAKKKKQRESLHTARSRYGAKSTSTRPRHTTRTRYY